MSETTLLVLIPILFVIVFSAMWLGITGFLSAMSGWPALERAFPDRPDPTLHQFRYQSARMRGVNFSGCLKFDVCSSGLRCSMWRIFGPFRQPFFVPWSQISAEPARIGLLKGARLTLGNAPVGTMAIHKRTFLRIAQASPHAQLRHLAQDIDRS